jgi:anthraniloyl-CoA monooxygenase
MKVLVAGGGPGGLYLALLLKREDPRRQITVVERDARGTTFGWGVVFTEDVLEFLEANDAESAAALSAAFVRWHELEVRNRDATITCGGHRFVAISRSALLAILQARCERLGVELRFQSAVEDRTQLAGYDLVVAADGVRSTVRALHPAFDPTIVPSKNRYVWFGTPKRFDRFTTSFRESEAGVFWVYAYPFDEQTATFNIECTESTWKRSGLDQADEGASLAYCARVFAADLQGHPLLPNRSTWSQFLTVTNQRWSDGNVVLVGDAAHTTHFTVGSGTKLAMEDAAALAQSLVSLDRLGDALQAYERSRRERVSRIQAAAARSTSWFENVERRMHLDPIELAASLFTRSERITYANLKRRDPSFLRRVDGRFGGEPLRSPLRLGATDLAGRIVWRATGLPSVPDLPGLGAILLERWDDEELRSWRAFLGRAPRAPKLLVELQADRNPEDATRAGADAVAARVSLAGEEALLAARAARRRGCDVVMTDDLDTSDLLRSEASIPTMVVADEASEDEVNTAIMAARADLFAVTRLRP